MKLKFLIVFSISLFDVSITYAACPRLINNDFPRRNRVSNIVKRVNADRTVRDDDTDTIFFCKQPDVDGYMNVSFVKSDLIGTSQEVFSLPNSGEKEVPIGESSVTIEAVNDIPDYQLQDLDSRIFATQKLRPWNERTIFHFYRRVPRFYSCNYSIHESIRRYLRNNAEEVFQAGKNGNFTQYAQRDDSRTWSIAKINDIELYNENDKVLKGEMSFYWLQNRNRGGGFGTGGNWRAGRYRVCHFAVAAELKIKTNFHGANYNIDESGDYKISVGVYTRD